LDQGLVGHAHIYALCAVHGSGASGRLNSVVDEIPSEIRGEVLITAPVVKGDSRLCCLGMAYLMRVTSVANGAQQVLLK